MRGKLRSSTVCMAAAVITALLFHHLAARPRRAGIEVTIQNTGSTTLHSILIRVTGARYYVGDLAPGKVANVTVRPTGESELDVELKGELGEAQLIKAGGYFEPGDTGRIDLKLNSCQLESCTDNTSIF